MAEGYKARLRVIPSVDEWAQGHTESVADAVAREQHRGRLGVRLLLAGARFAAWLDRTLRRAAS